MDYLSVLGALIAFCMAYRAGLNYLGISNRLVREIVCFSLALLILVLTVAIYLFATDPLATHAVPSLITYNFK